MGATDTDVQSVAQGARALPETLAQQRTAPLAWVAQPMATRIDLEDCDAVQAILDADR